MIHRLHTVCIVPRCHSSVPLKNHRAVGPRSTLWISPKKAVRIQAIGAASHARTVVLFIAGWWGPPTPMVGNIRLIMVNINGYYMVNDG